MLAGKDVLHVEQSLGKQFVNDSLSGYYNDLTDKGIKCRNIDENNLPYNYTDSGEKCQLLVSVLQYGLGSYDLFLETNEKKYYDKFISSVQFVSQKQNVDGSFKMYAGIRGMKKDKSAMIQGEAVSLLLRAYKETKEEQYFIRAKQSLQFMLKSVEEGGTTVYCPDGFYFQELFDKGQNAILNGWIFAFFGLYDYTLVSDEEKYKTIKERSLNYLAESLHKYDRKYWSNYNQENTITSPFYHKLHIAQLAALALISDREEFKYYQKKWEAEYNNKFIYWRAFIVKAVQKLKNRNDSELNIVE